MTYWNWNLLFQLTVWHFFLFDFFFILSLRQLPILMSLLYHNDTIIKKEKELLRALLGQFCKLEVVIVNHFLIFQSMDSALNLLSQHLME